MKKDEAVIVAKEKAKVMCDYLQLYLEDESINSGRVEFVGDNSILSVDIFLNKGEKMQEFHYNLGMSVVYADMFIREVMDILADNFIPSEHVGVSPYFSIRGLPTTSRDGVFVYNTETKLKIDVNFWCHGKDYSKIMGEFNGKIDKYRKQAGTVSR